MRTNKKDFDFVIISFKKTKENPFRGGVMGTDHDTYFIIERKEGEVNIFLCTIHI